MDAIGTARAIAREQLTAAIKQAARRQLAAEGAPRLSLRQVARDLGMASSALYRYFPDRDRLLTALIVDAYDGLGEVMEAADAAERRTAWRRRWRAVCTAARGWALAHRAEYALVFGSPVPDYRAPADTVTPAARAPLALVRVVEQAWAAGIVTPAATSGRLPPDLTRQLDGLGSEIVPGLPPDLLARTAAAWAELFGLLSFELFGQFVGSVDPTGPFFDWAVEAMADSLGLPAAADRPDRRTRPVSN